MKQEIWLRTFVPRNNITMKNQRTGIEKSFSENEITLQVEGVNGKIISVRGKYPDDDWFSHCQLSKLKEVE